MPPRLLIAFGHKRLRGKDTCASMVLNALAERGHAGRTDAFAAPLKAACCTVFGFSHAQVYGNQKETVDPFWGFTPRWAMQKMGTDAIRNNVHADVWVKSLEQRFLASSESVIVTDVRFPNEAAGIKKMGGTLIQVTRAVPFDAEKDSHASEVALDAWTAWDHTINNNGTLADLEETVQRIVQSELHKHQP